MSCDEPLAQTGRGTDVSLRVVRKVADELEVDPLEVKPLYESINPDALNQLFQAPSAAGHDVRVAFTIAGCDVVVYGSGTVEVSETAATSRQESDEDH